MFSGSSSTIMMRAVDVVCGRDAGGAEAPAAATDAAAAATLGGMLELEKAMLIVASSDQIRPAFAPEVAQRSRCSVADWSDGPPAEARSATPVLSAPRWRTRFHRAARSWPVVPAAWPAG